MGNPSSGMGRSQTLLLQTSVKEILYSFYSEIPERIARFILVTYGCECSVGRTRLGGNQRNQMKDI